MQIRAKFALALLAVTLVPLFSLVVAVVVFNQSKVESIGNVAQWQAQAARVALNRDLQHAITQAKSWATDEGLLRAAAAAADLSRRTLESRWRENQYIYSARSERLKQFQRFSDNRFAEIFFTDARGYVVASTNPTTDFGQGPEDDPPKGEAWWSQAKETGLRIGKMQYDKSADSYSIDMSVAMSYENRFVGVLKAVYDVESILEIIGQANVGRSGHTVLVDNEGRILAAPARFQNIVFNPDYSLGGTKALAHAQTGETNYSFDQIPWVGQALVGVASSRTLETNRVNDWSILLVVPMEEALISARQVRLLGLSGLALTFFAVLVGSFLLSRRMSRPLVEMDKAVSQIQGGNFHVKVPYGGVGDEVARLARSLNAMTESLQAYDEMNIEKIQSLNRELEVANRELEHLARYDSLTGLVNVRVFRETLDRELKRSSRSGQPVSLLLLDIDYFKTVNDTHGHQVGDAVLRQLGELLRDTVRSTDCAARYGGEELAVVLPDTSQAGALKLAEKIRKLVSIEDFDTGERTLDITVSIGVAYGYGASETSEELIRRADRALYRAKESGRNRVEPAQNA